MTLSTVKECCPKPASCVHSQYDEYAHILSSSASIFQLQASRCYAIVATIQDHGRVHFETMAEVYRIFLGLIGFTQNSRALSLIIWKSRYGGRHFTTGKLSIVRKCQLSKQEQMVLVIYLQHTKGNVIILCMQKLLENKRFMAWDIILCL